MLEALGRAREIGFLGAESLEIQVEHALGFALSAESYLGLSQDQPHSQVPLPARFLDLGSGGGLPGLVLAHRWGDAQAVLLDSSLRKTAFLEDVVVECGWADRVRVVRSRAEEAARSELRGQFDLVVARSFGPPPVTAECATGFLREGGILVVSEPPPRSLARTLEPQSDSGRWPVEGLGRVGLEPLGLWRGEYVYEVLRQTSICPSRFPRRVGIPRKRPLYDVPATVSY